MPLTSHFLLLGFLLCSSSSISCFANLWHDCQLPKQCGESYFGYPFGGLKSGCGDPDFQIDCVSDVYPVLHISGEDYRILEPSFLDNNIENHLITIFNSKHSLDTCTGRPGNYTQRWWYGPSFDMASELYTNLTFWRDCDSEFQNRAKLETVNFSKCDWQYSFDPDIDLDSIGKQFCQMHFQLPVKKDLVKDRAQLLNRIECSIEIKFHIDPSRNLLCGACEKSNGICGYNPDNSVSFRCYCRDGTYYPDKCPSHGGRDKAAIIIGCSTGVAALIAIIAVVLFFMFYGKRRKTLSRGLASRDTETAMLPRRQMSNLPIFSYEELQQATNCFNEENELGDGGFGSVYLGKLSDGRTVAVKRLYQDNSRRLEQFLNEVQIFSTLNHPRVVRLYGCTSADSPELLLVYEFVSNGTLADHLHGDRRGPRGLPWDARLNIAIQTAEALDFLHSVDPPIFHRDVKSTNILLDENLYVKVADFGLCRLVPVNASHVTTAPQGTPGYVDPEYHQCYQLTEKSDVYSFGVVLVEIISAKLAVDINRNRKEISLANMAKSKIQEGALNELVDPQLGIEMNHAVKVAVSAVAELALRCLASERDYRPQMKEVVAQLREIKQSWDTSTGPGDQQWGSFSNTKEPLSPISVQDKWSSKSSTPNTSA